MAPRVRAVQLTRSRGDESGRQVLQGLRENSVGHTLIVAFGCTVPLRGSDWDSARGGALLSHSASDRGRPAERGISTIEIAVVLVLVGILLAVATPSIRRALARETLNGHTRGLRFDLIAARRAAMTRRATVTVSVSGQTYTIAAASGGSTVRQQTLPPDITISTTCPSSFCSFNRRGTPIAAGTITLTSALTGQSYSLTIEPGTGRVTSSGP